MNKYILLNSSLVSKALANIVIFLKSDYTLQILALFFLKYTQISAHQINIKKKLSHTNTIKETDHTDICTKTQNCIFSPFACICNTTLFTEYPSFKEGQTK